MSESATPAPVDAQAALNALSPEARASWELTGDWPSAEKPTSEPDPDPEPDEPAPDAAVVADTKAAPIDPSGKDYTPPNSRSKRTAKDQEFINARIRDSVREATATLQSEIAELRAKSTPEPAKPAAPKAPTFPIFTDWVLQDGNGEKSFEDYLDSRQDFRDTQRRETERAESERIAKETRDRETDATRATQFEAWVGRRDAFIARQPDFVEKAGPFLSSLTPGTPVGDAFLESPVGPEMAWHLVTHPDDMARLSRLSLNSLLRELGKIESLYESDTDSPRASASAGPAAKTVTTAPAPPTTLHARSATPSDPSRAAVLRGDFGAFEAEENRKAVASRR
jgi:hypothetical protein